jgi:hypothetical protein
MAKGRRGFARKMLAMRSGSTLVRPTGPFVIPARTLLLIAGVLAIALGAVNLYHERHVGEVDNVYVAVATAVGVVWLASLALAFRGARVGLVLAGAAAFLEFGLISSSHFVTGAASMSGYVKKEGLSVAPISMVLLTTSLLTFMVAVVCWSHPRGRLRVRTTVPLLVLALLGASLVILYATDSVRRNDFGTASPEDGTFAASVAATFWLFGGLWVARARRTGALLIGLGTFMTSFSFTALHLLKGGHTLGDIAVKSGALWAIIAGAMAILAILSLLLALAILLAPFLERRPTVSRLVR